MVLWIFDLLWKNYGTLEKTMELLTKLWYNGKNYGSLLRTMKIRFTKKKTI